MPQPDTKIRAVIFDFGGVLLDWNPRHLYRKLLNDDPDAVEKFLTEIGFSEWNLQQDKGRPFAEAVSELSAKFPHHGELIAAFHQRWDETIAGPIQGTVDILRTLKDAGYALYGLSNWSAETFYRINANYDFLTWFDTIVISGEVKLIKPDPQIFELLLERTGRTPQECVFIDDVLANVEGARKVGITAIQFESPAQLEAELRRLNVLPAKISAD
jgi:2-haloacid dehalogenase